LSDPPKISLEQVSEIPPAKEPIQENHSAPNTVDFSALAKPSMTPPTPESINTNTCIPKSKNRPWIELPLACINAKIEHMRTYALIGKFIGFWPTKSTFLNWIATK
jgi:hypothetical protein